MECAFSSMVQFFPLGASAFKGYVPRSITDPQYVALLLLCGDFDKGLVMYICL